MLTNIEIRNFKRFEEVDVPLGTSVVFIGPNDSGKTSALQALALWNRGLRSWQEKYRGKSAPKSRPVVTINRRDLIAIPVPRADLLWRNLRVRTVTKDDDKPRPQNIRIDIVVDGITDSECWCCGLEFEYASVDSFYCRPLRIDGEAKPVDRMPIPDQALQTKVAYLPPMSGLAAVEPRWELGRVNVLIGEGQTAQVLRNLCHNLAEYHSHEWWKVQEHIRQLFGVKLDRPDYIAERGEITMSYSDSSGVSLALSSSGRGLQQTLLLLAYLYTNRSSVLLLDEPDAHLEILRQQQIYHLLSEIASEMGSQIIAASHSEMILNEAAGRDMVVAFVGQPHRIDGSSAKAQVSKALSEIGYENYYQAEQTGWVLYLEGPTDLSNLRSLAQTLDHRAKELLDRPFVKYVGNQPSKARDQFYGLREAKPDLVGIVINDRDVPVGEASSSLLAIQWKKREIENYLASPTVLREYAKSTVTDEWPEPGPIFGQNREQERIRRIDLMDDVIQFLVPPIALQNPNDDFWREGKGSDFLDRVFVEFYNRIGHPNPMSKSTYHRLAALAKPEDLDEEVTDVLDQIVGVAKQARPAGD